MKRSFVLVVAMLVFCFLGQTPRPTSIPSLETQLSEWSKAGVTYRYSDDSTIELQDTTMGWSCVKTLRVPDESAIRNWAAMRGIPVIEIDPTLVDTSQWTGWYDYWTTVPVSNWFGGVPTKVWDFDGNGYPEVYGYFGYIGSIENRIYEVHPDGTSLERFVYTPNPGGGTQVLDIDHNGLLDIVFSRGSFTFAYEQPTHNSLPTELKFAYNKYNGLAPYSSVEPMIDMDGDSVMDFVHRGADTATSQYYLMCVSEYDTSLQNFVNAWFPQPPAYGHWEGFDVGDYDGDGRMDFVLSYMFGKLLVYENTGEDTYANTFEDSLPLVNLHYQTSGDVDGDGKREFFVGATMGTGNWTVMYETDRDDHYNPRSVIHLLSGGSLDEPTYFTNDVDGDGRLELVILSGGWLYVFKSNADDSYYLWYLKQGPSNITVSFYDMNGDGIKDILWGKIDNNNLVSKIYKGTSLVSAIQEPASLPQRAVLEQNYPNPFNPVTTIEYSLPRRDRVHITIYDMLGREVAILVDSFKDAGVHKLRWDGSTVASGVYLCRMETSTTVLVRKMLLVR